MNNSRMNAEQRMDCLLKKFDKITESHGDFVTLNTEDVRILMNQCGFSNMKEISFYMKTLDERGLINADCSADNTLLAAQVTVDGYSYLEKIRDT